MYILVSLNDEVRLYISSMGWFVWDVVVVVVGGGALVQGFMR